MVQVSESSDQNAESIISKMSVKMILVTKRMSKKTSKTLQVHNKCKFLAKDICAFSHKDNTDEEKDDLKNRLKDLEEIIKNLKTANKQKDFDLATKEKTIEKKVTESKYLKDEKYF